MRPIILICKNPEKKNYVDPQPSNGFTEIFFLDNNNDLYIFICVQECIALMPNHEKANAATHWLVKRLPRGADKVLAAVGLGQ